MLALFCDVDAAPERIVVIVNPRASVDLLDVHEVRRLFLGKPPLDANLKLAAVNLPSSSHLRESFDRIVLGKSPRHIRMYWVEKIFTGKGLPPIELADSNAVIDFVAQNLNAIGYIEESKLVARVKSVLVVP